MSATTIPAARTPAHNVSAALERATSADWLAGLDWYAVAASEARALAADYGVSFEAAAGVIPALSPRTSWEVNVAYARELFETGDARTLERNVAKARAIAAGCQVFRFTSEAQACAWLKGSRMRSAYALHIRFPNTSLAASSEGNQ
jgi:hypothetical protein